jgi:hypothetical protein
MVAAIKVMDATHLVGSEIDPSLSHFCRIGPTPGKPSTQRWVRSELREKHAIASNRKGVPGSIGNRNPRIASNKLRAPHANNR